MNENRRKVPRLASHLCYPVLPHFYAGASSRDQGSACPHPEATRLSSGVHPRKFRYLPQITVPQRDRCEITPLTANFEIRKALDESAPNTDAKKCPASEKRRTRSAGKSEPEKRPRKRVEFRPLKRRDLTHVLVHRHTQNKTCQLWRTLPIKSSRCVCVLIQHAVCGYDLWCIISRDALRTSKDAPLSHASTPQSMSSQRNSGQETMSSQRY